MRNTIKAYLKTIEKTKMDERTKAPSSTVTPVESESAKAPQNGDGQEEEVPTPADDQQDTEAVEQEDTPTVDVQPSIEVSKARDTLSNLSNASIRIATPNRPRTSTMTWIFKSSWRMTTRRSLCGL
jgi:hypothetical protein